MSKYPRVDAFFHRPSCTITYIISHAGRAAIVDPAHRIQGGGYAMAELSYLKEEHIDGFLTVSDREAAQTARRLAVEEGIFAGFSSGANAAAALKLLEGECRGRTVAITICDSGLKYLSTDLWDSCP